MLDPQSIRSNYLVYGLADDQLESIAEIAFQRTVASGEALCRQGEVGSEMFIVLEGRLSVQTSEGERLAEVGPNSVVGEMALIDTRPRSASVIALETVRVAAIASADLRELMATDGNLGFLVLCNITRVLSDRLRHADTRIDALMSAAIKA